MKNQQTPDQVVHGLPTLRSKILALSHAGYSRFEIRKFLDVPYRTVRNQLLSVGITTGLRGEVEVQREPLTVDVGDTPHPPTLSGELLEAAFSLLGEWTAVGPEKIALNAEAPTVPGVYAFVVDDVVAYVGLTNNGLRARFDQYRIGYEEQRTNWRIKSEICKALSSGQCVKVLIATPPRSDWHGLPVITAAELEAGLIEKIRPRWNILGFGKTRSATAKNATEDALP